MTDGIEKLGEAIDRVDSLAHALELPVSDRMHVEQLRELLPSVVAELKAGFEKVTGEHPWGP